MSSKILFDVPSGASAKVRIIDSTFRLAKMPVDFLLTPPLDGFETLQPLPTWSFLVESSTGKKALFDLGVPPNWQESFAPAVLKRLNDSDWEISAERHVADILESHGVGRSEINSVIWSHWHWDHIGDITTFPGSTELVVGPGFKKEFYPGHPTLPDAPVREAYFKDRTLREIDFTSQSPPLKAGAFQAFDFFGDGSFYLLDTPGHAVGHLAGLARTSTNPDTFIFMGGDLCHHGGEIRPSSHLRIPHHVEYPLPDQLRAKYASGCPGGELFEKLNVSRGRKADEPFFDPGIGDDKPLAIRTIREAQEADAREDVLFIFAHDATMRGVVELFPKEANAWKEKGWRGKVLWKFLEDLAVGIKDVSH